MKSLIDSLRELVVLFEQRLIPYAVMGGMAVRVHGIPRPTFDLDFTITIRRESLPALYAAAADLGYSVPDQFASGWVDSVAGMPLVKFSLYLESHGIDIDLFLAESRFQMELMQRRVRAEVDGVPVWLVSPEDLILLKLVAGRPRDLGDVEDVLFTQGQLDTSYMRHWADELGVRVRLEETLSRHHGD